MAVVASVDVYRCVTCGYIVLVDTGKTPDLTQHSHAITPPHGMFALLGVARLQT